MGYKKVLERVKNQQRRKNYALQEARSLTLLLAEHAVACAADVKYDGNADPAFVAAVLNTFAAAYAAEFEKVPSWVYEPSTDEADEEQGSR